MIRVLASSDLGEGEMKSVQAGDQDIALYRVGGEVFATSNICTHQYALMTEGYLDGDCVECPLHQALFSIRTGQPIDAPTEVPLPVFQTEERDGSIFVAI